ncbi:unnamed protein product, partial [Mesorhabditis belari]|uniref:BOD1/SHG1 domain-containing protein n=1 Tax=Mesorhabditis belari TaxID=2138241 RepID=A0AAF3JAE7_9BILA
MPLPNKDDVSEQVCTAIKKEGKFDEIRREVVEKIKERGQLNQLMDQARKDAEAYLETIPDNMSKEEIRAKLREVIGRFEPQLNRIVQSSVREPWVEGWLSKEVQRKVRLAYGLPTDEHL